MPAVPVRCIHATLKDSVVLLPDVPDPEHVVGGAVGQLAVASAVAATISEELAVLLPPDLDYK